MTINLDNIDFDGITTAQGLYTAYETVFKGFPTDDLPTAEQLSAVEAVWDDPRWETTTTRLTDAGITPADLTPEQQDNLANWTTSFQVDEMLMGLGGGITDSDG